MPYVHGEPVQRLSCEHAQATESKRAFEENIQEFDSYNARLSLYMRAAKTQRHVKIQLVKFCKILEKHQLLRQQRKGMTASLLQQTISSSMNLAGSTGHLAGPLLSLFWRPAPRGLGPSGTGTAGILARSLLPCSIRLISPIASLPCCKGPSKGPLVRPHKPDLLNGCSNKHERTLDIAICFHTALISGHI